MSFALTPPLPPPLVLVPGAGTAAVVVEEPHEAHLTCNHCHESGTSSDGIWCWVRCSIAFHLASISSHRKWLMPAHHTLNKNRFLLQLGQSLPVPPCFYISWPLPSCFTPLQQVTKNDSNQVPICPACVKHRNISGVLPTQKVLDKRRAAAAAVPRGPQQRRRREEDTTTAGAAAVTNTLPRLDVAGCNYKHA